MSAFFVGSEGGKRREKGRDGWWEEEADDLERVLEDSTRLMLLFAV